MKIGMMISMVCVVMLACGGGERLREAEEQLSIAEERLAAYENAAALAAAARYECNMKVAAALLVATDSLAEAYTEAYPDEGIGVEVQEDIETQRDFIEMWIERSSFMVHKYLGIHYKSDLYALEIVSVTDDIRGGEC